MNARAGLTAVIVGGLLSCSTLAGCSWLEDEPRAAPTGPERTPTLLQDADRLAEAVDATLGRRQAALRRGDLDAVVRQAVDDPGARRTQRRYAVNLSRLPVAVLRYAEPSEIAVDGDQVRVRVRQVLRLSRFDAAPVRALHELVLEPARRGRLRVVSEQPLSLDPSTGGAQPWDVRAIAADRRDGVLGVFDVGSVGDADPVVTSTIDAAEDVAELVPYRWNRPVVVYALSDLTLLDAIAGLPGGDPDRLDGVAFPVRSDPDGPVVAERVILHPRMLTADAMDRERLLRHELTHVALGARDELVPRWLAEGIAEWVSVQPLGLGERLISAEAVRAAEQGIDALPDDESFNVGPTSGANYGVAWQVCDEIAATYGTDALWSLLEAMDSRGASDPEQVLQQVLGTSGSELAAAAGDRILRQYG